MKMENVGFEMPIEEKKCNIDNLQNYFKKRL